MKSIKHQDFSHNPVDSYEIYKKMQAMTYTVGLRIKEARIAKGLTRQDIGKELGIYQTICRVELGIFEYLDIVYEIAQYLEMDMEKLFEEPFTYSEKPSYGAICRENKILKKMLADQRIKI